MGLCVHALGIAAWRRTPPDGVFCAVHAYEFRCHEAAKAATRLARARLTLRDPSSAPWQRWLAVRVIHRARALHGLLLAEIAGAEDHKPRTRSPGRHLRP